MQYRNSREVLGEVKNVTVSHSCGHWTISIQTERDVSDAIHPSTSAVGIDLGIAQFATLSNGQVFAAINSFKQKQKRLARYQRALSRKVKFSQNWKKQKTKSESYIKRLRIFARITCIRPPPSSAKATR
jgi:putative transposase